MDIRRIKGIKRIVIPQAAQAAGATGTARVSTGPIVIKGKKSKRRKLSRSSRLFEKITRRSALANRAVLDQYLDRHKRSNRKKKNGWLKDLSKNMFTAGRKGRKRFKLSTLF
ncbi:hypothetical protein [Polyangium sp. y55x31]|uniref:DUF6312 domain-containing protein n=1 Tax=Polyangium sp. y55x31 TaxID=3042688 RepID=UPI0024823835|nr:hypothetical protein [Polyangium sp. y55x31]MDI1475032.1 hypothetical protein [Polyangium sp. y55x31]